MHRSDVSRHRRLTDSIRRRIDCLSKPWGGGRPWKARKHEAVVLVQAKA